MLKSVINKIKSTRKKSKLIKKGKKRNLYKTKENLYYWLDPQKYLDSQIVSNGYFEPKLTKIVKNLVSEGNYCLDVGANIGYYTVLLSKLIGSKGIVHAFEPTNNYKTILYDNIRENNISNVIVHDYALSNKEEELSIYIGECSATIHPTNNITKQEKINTRKLDDIVTTLDLKKLDIIKVDIDGHEPFFLEGAWKTIEKYNPYILLEISHENYYQSNIFAWDFYRMLKEKEYYIFSENDLHEFVDELDFLKECGNFKNSANIIMVKKDKINHIKYLRSTLFNN